jgi:lambda family phage portal protein
MKLKQTFLDKLVSFVNPQAGVQRLMAKKALTKFEYDAVKYTRERRGPSNLSGAEDFRSNYDRVELMKRARDLAENNGLVRSILMKFASHVASNLTYQARTDNPKANTEIEAYWNEWFNNCDLSTRHTGSTLMQVATMSMLRDGDFLFVLVRDKNGDLKLQGIESDRLGDPYKTYTSLELIGGIHIDRDTGAPTAYDIYNRSIGDFYSYQVTISASQGFHYFDPLRIDQYRGVSAFHTAINDATDIYDIVNFEKLAAKVASSQSAVVKRSNNNASDLSALTTEENFDNQQIKLESMESGKVSYLEPGEDIIFPDGPSRPSGAFAEFHKILLRNICMGLGIPYSFAVDPSAMSGPTARLEMQQAGRTFNRYQKLLNDKVLNPIKNIVIADGVARGMISGNGAKTTKGIFNFGANVSIDLGRESMANIAEFKAGLTTASSIYAEKGLDVEAAFRARAIETKMIQDLAKEYGVPAQAVSEILLPTGQPAQAGQPGQTTQDGQQVEGQEDVIGQSLNGAQVASLINVINAVAAGALSKEGAVSVITAAFPTISREQAIGIVAGVQSGKIIPTTEKEKQAAQDGQQDEGQGGTPVPETPKAPVAPTGLSQKKSNLEELQNLSQHEWKMLIAGMMGGIELGKYDGIDFTPPEGARESAKRALDVREGKPASQKGMTPVGIARARDLINGVKFSPDTVRRMKAFFDRHEVDKKGETWDEQGKGWQAWNGWGGDAGYSWAKKVVGQMESRDKNLSEPKDQTEFADDKEILNPCGMKDDGTFDDKNTCSSGYGRPKLVGGYSPKRPGGKIIAKPAPPAPPPPPSAPTGKTPPPPSKTPSQEKEGRNTSVKKKEAVERIENELLKMGVKYVDLPNHNDAAFLIQKEVADLQKAGYGIPKSLGRGKYMKGAVAWATGVSNYQDVEFNHNKGGRYREITEFSETITLSVKSGHWASPSVVAHEHGHSLHGQIIGRQGFRDYWTWSKLPSEQSARIRPLAAKVSRYATTDPLEFVAETFAGHVAGKRYSTEIYEAYKELKGPKLKF